ncbi:methionine ABC transporter ATP-binding protein, partial [Coprobacillus cateniformis]|nr:methionine ABC transporter ATP-binding protein [Coprobacillus cateniformis]
ILLRLTFDEEISRLPIVSKVMKEIDLDLSIVSGNLTNTIDSSFGVLIVNVLGGDKQEYENVIQKFKDYQVIVEVI